MQNFCYKLENIFQKPVYETRRGVRNSANSSIMNEYGNDVFCFSSPKSVEEKLGRPLSVSFNLKNGDIANDTSSAEVMT